MQSRPLTLACCVALLSSLAVACGEAPGDDPITSAKVDVESATPSPAATPGLALSVHTTLGLPEAASTDDPKHALLVKPQFVVSFDSTRKNPRWTSWELTKKWLGATARSLEFEPDPTLPATLPQAKEADYAHSGYDRGHICPSADRTDSKADNDSTFEFTNAVPQTVESNTGTWETLETEERDLVTAGHHVFIIAGSRYAAETTIGAGVAVPTSMFKVVVVMDGDDLGPSDVTTSTRVVSVDIPNTHDVHGDWSGYRTTFGAARTRDRPSFHVRRPGRDPRRARREDGHAELI